jgi:hypothetical protein
MAIRGTWLLHDAIRRRWNEAALDDAFREAWPDKTLTNVLPFNDTEARAESDKHPRPYCVVEYSTPIHKGNSAGGRVGTSTVYQDHPVNFHIFGNTKGQAEEFAKLVAEAFVQKKLTIEQDRHIDTLIDPDFVVREGDRTWRWVLQYRFRIDGDIPAPRT